MSWRALAISGQTVACAIRIRKHTYHTSRISSNICFIPHSEQNSVPGGGVHPSKIKELAPTSSVENVDLDFLNALVVSVSRNSNFARPPDAPGQTTHTHTQTDAGWPTQSRSAILCRIVGLHCITGYGLRCIALFWKVWIDIPFRAPPLTLTTYTSRLHWNPL